MSELSDYLKKARSLIENPENWIKGKTSNGKGYCILGALNNFSVDFQVYLRALYHIASLIEINPVSISAGDFIAEWNDTPGRTHSEILALFDKAIALVEQSGDI